MKADWQNDVQNKPKLRIGYLKTILIWKVILNITCVKENVLYWHNFDSEFYDYALRLADTQIPLLMREYVFMQNN